MCIEKKEKQILVIQNRIEATKRRLIINPHLYTDTIIHNAIATA